MDILNTKVKKLYNSYLFPSLIAGMVISIYAFVDTIAVGQSEGPNGAAALAIINPLFSISSLIGMLFGVGGSVLYSQAKGEKDDKKGRLYFTASLLKNHKRLKFCPFGRVHNLSWQSNNRIWCWLRCFRLEKS